jgi:putative ABC transport system substrate-binding protein
VIVAAGFPVILACKVANMPTVVAFGGVDPVATHLIDALARPGGNITGISDNATGLSTKRLTLIKQAVPNLQRVAMLWNRDDLRMSMRYEASASAARSVGVVVGIAAPAHGAGETVLLQDGAIVFGGILRPTVGMMHTTPWADCGR